MENTENIGLSKEDKEMNRQIMEAIDKISVQCPVHKVNLNNDNKQAIAGRYLMTFADVEQVLKGISQMSDLNDHTFLFFDNRHIDETIQILYGMTGVLVDARLLTKDSQTFILENIASTINQNRVVTYGTFKRLMDGIYSKGFASKGIHEVSMRNIKNILYMIWFVPYNQIDAIADQIINEYAKRHPEEMASITPQEDSVDA